MSLNASAAQGLSETKIKVDLAFMPPDPNPTTIGSVAKYLLVTHVTRGLIALDRNGSMSGELANSWTVDKGQRIFKFQIRQGLLFSNGDPITAQSIADTISFRKTTGKQIHFNFSEIEKVVAQGNEVTIILKNSSPLFLFQLTHPEFGVLHKSTMQNPALGPTVCSGHYCLESFSSNRILLKKSSAQPEAPDIIEWVGSSADKYEKLKQGQLDFVLEPAILPPIDPNFETLKPHIGFTYWLSLNPNSQVFRSKAVREAFQGEVFWQFRQNVHNFPTYSPASQLFLPGGPGRLDAEATDRFWTSRRLLKANSESKRHVKVLTSNTFDMNTDLENSISKSAAKFGWSIQFTRYSNQAEFEKHLKTSQFDLYLTNNDFSGYDLSLTLPVAFNPEKPLIVLTNRELIDKISSDPILESRGEKLKLLSNRILEDALIVPLAYRTMFISKTKRLDLSQWSQLYPEIAFWKAKVGK